MTYGEQPLQTPLSYEDQLARYEALQRDQDHRLDAVHLPTKALRALSAQQRDTLGVGVERTVYAHPVGDPDQVGTGVTEIGIRFKGIKHHDDGRSYPTIVDSPVAHLYPASDVPLLPLVTPDSPPGDEFSTVDAVILHGMIVERQDDQATGLIPRLSTDYSVPVKYREPIWDRNDLLPPQDR